MLKILLLGGSGFVGKNMFQTLSTIFNVYTTQRNKTSNDDSIYFDITNESTWQNLLTIDFDVVINSIGYGVVKLQRDTDTLFQINYILPMRLREYLAKKKADMFWVQIGTAFEYSLTNTEITEESETNPMTLYGISKLMFSNYLIKSANNNFLLLRPFAMFGQYEDNSKIIPALINAQKTNEAVDLSTGQQQRDYFFVEDFTNFIAILLEKGIYKFSQNCINVGSGSLQKLTDIADKLASKCPNYSKGLWKWGVIKQREGESPKFYNASTRCHDLGLKLTPLDDALFITVKHYWEKK